MLRRISIIKFLNDIKPKSWLLADATSIFVGFPEHGKKRKKKTTSPLLSHPHIWDPQSITLHDCQSIVPDTRRALLLIQFSWIKMLLLMLSHSHPTHRRKRGNENYFRATPPSSSFSSLSSIRRSIYRSRYESRLKNAQSTPGGTCDKT